MSVRENALMKGIATKHMFMLTSQMYVNETDINKEIQLPAISGL